MSTWLRVTKGIFVIDARLLCRIVERTGPALFGIEERELMERQKYVTSTRKLLQACLNIGIININTDQYE